MLQKVPLHIASAEANLKETIRNSVVAPPIVSTQPTSTGSPSSYRKRKLSKSTEQPSPSSSVAKRRRIRLDSGCMAQQLPSPKSSRDSLLAQGGLPTADQHRPISDTLLPGSKPASRSISTAKNSNLDLRSSMPPPTPRIISITASRTDSIALSNRPALPSSLSHKKQRASDAPVTPYFERPVSSALSVTPAPPNHLEHPNGVFELPVYTRTPLRIGSKQPHDRLSKPSAPLPSSIGFSAVRRQLTINPILFQAYNILFHRAATRETLHSNH